MSTPTIHDTEWHAMLMGSEGWAVFAGPRMIASNLSEAKARLIATAPDLLKALERTEQTLRNLGNGFLTGDLRTIALNEARNCQQAIENAR